MDSPHDHTDVNEFLALIEACHAHAHTAMEVCADCAGRLAHAAALYRADLLAGFGLKDCIAFEEWLAVKRERLRQSALQVLERLADYYERVGDYKRMEQSACRQVEIEPLHESAHRQVMRALAYRGQPNEALLHYETLRTQLSSDLGIEPEPATQAIYERLRVLRASPVSGTHPPDQPWLRPETASSSCQSLVGRQKEMQALEQAFQRACGGQGQVALVTGEAGWGKTALLNEFVHRILEQDYSAVVASASGMAYTGIGDPYFHRRLRGDLIRSSQ